MQQFFSSSLSRVTNGVQGISSGMNAQVSRSVTAIDHQLKADFEALQHLLCPFSMSSEKPFTHRSVLLGSFYTILQCWAKMLVKSDLKRHLQVNAFCSLQMPSSTQLAYFAAFLGSGVIFLVLAFTIFLPVIMLAPSKFAICFTIGSVLVLSAFVSLRGWRHQLTHMFSADRLLFTLGE